MFEIAAVDEAGGSVAGGLDAEFEPEVCPGIVFRQKREDGIAEAVRTGCDRKTDDIRESEGFVVLEAQGFDIGVGIGKILKICDVLGVVPFGSEAETLFLHLFVDGMGFVAGKFAGAGRAAKRTSAETFASVAVGAGETAVYREFDNFFSELLFQGVIDGSVKHR